MSAEDINPQRLRIFSLVEINRAYKQEASFFHFFLQAYVDSHDYIIDNLNLDQVDKNFLLYNNMINLLEIEEQTLPKDNRALIFILDLALLCYIQNNCSNLF